MTTVRSSAYRRVVKTLRDVGPAKLWPAEQECIREAADTLLFCSDLDDPDGRRALTAVAVLTDDLIDVALDAASCQQLVDDIWA